MCFNPRSHVGSDIIVTCPCPFGCVSIHAPTWGATLEGAAGWGQLEFQSTLPRGERRNNISNLSGGRCFNPRSHVGSDITDGRRFQRTTVSIHAPTWGATSPRLSWQTRPKVSIHAPTWGATACKCISLRQKNVSIHAPTWGATKQREGREEGRKVSIHAPTWGATCLSLIQRRRASFQSTLPRGERRQKSNDSQLLGVEFQSTLPRGERLFFSNYINISQINSTFCERHELQ